jgi:hypothetical protein
MSIISNVTEADIKLFKKQYVNLPDVRDEIKRLDSITPTNKRTKEYKEWKKDINFLIDMYNTRVGYTYYEKIK